MTDEERTLIETVKKTLGRTWKSKLSVMWQTGCYHTVPADIIPLLQRLRNTRGPTWLYRNA